METAKNMDNKQISSQFDNKMFEQNGVENTEVIDNLCGHS